MEQILESTYLKDREKWERKALMMGGLEICDDESGWPIYTIGVDQEMMDNQEDRFW